MIIHVYISVGNFDLLRQGGNMVSLSNLVMELKKASNHPFLFDGVEQWSDDPKVQLDNLVRNSGKMYLLDKLLGRKSDIFSLNYLSRMTCFYRSKGNWSSRSHLFPDGPHVGKIFHKSAMNFCALSKPVFKGHSFRLLALERIPPPAT
jgi:chromodomain-helicase-DNA-binding protein 1